MRRRTARSALPGNTRFVGHGEQSSCQLIPRVVLGFVLAVHIAAAFACNATKAPTPQTGAAADPAVEKLQADPYVFSRWETFSKEQGLPDHWVYAVKAKPDRVYAGTRHGAAYMDRKTGKWTVLPVESAPGANDGIAYRVVVSIDVDEDGHAWFGTFKGLTWWDGRKFTNFRMPEGQNPMNPEPKGLINNVVYGVTHLGDEIWIATTDGTSVYNKKTGAWKSWYLDNAPMDEVWCYGISSSPNKIWLAAWGSGLLEYTVDRNHWQAYHDPDKSFTVDLLRNDGILSQMSTASSFSEGYVWVSSYFGVTRYDGKNFRDWDEDHGLPSNFLNSVKAHGKTAWVSSDKGLAGFVNDQWYTYRRVSDDKGTYGTLTIADADGKGGKVYRTETAIPYNFVWQADFDQDGSIWVATSDGLGHGISTGKEE